MTGGHTVIYHKNFTHILTTEIHILAAIPTGIYPTLHKRIYIRVRFL